MFRNTMILPALVAAALLAKTSDDTWAQQPLPAEGNETQLLEVLESDAEMFDKAKACQRLAIIGTADAVPVLARLLADEQLSHYARFGLESNPSPAVNEALREALGRLEGKPLVGVINSIGVRRDAKAVDALVDAASSDDDQVAAAALAALGSIATDDSVRAIEQALGGKETRRIAAADACLTAADLLLGDGENARAASIFDTLGAAELPKHINVASRFGEIRAGSGDVADLMMEYLGSEDNDLFRIGLQLAHDLGGAETTQSLVKKMESLAASRKALLISVLGSRGDKSALPAVIAAADSDNADVRIAAIDVLGELGDVSVLPILLQAAASGDQDLAVDSLAELGGEGVDAAVSDRLAKTDGPQRIVLVQTVARRGISSAIPVLLDLMKSDDPELRNASIDALGMTVGLKQLPPLVDQLIKEDAGQTAEPMKDALRKACQRMSDRDAAADILLSRMGAASDSTKGQLMDLLIYVGGEKALAGAGAEAAGSDDAAADAATQALGKWLTPDVAPVLLELAKSGNEKYRVRCLRGYIRVIRQFGLPTGKRMQMSREAMKTATRDEERKLVLDTLTRFPSANALKMITPHLNNPALQQAASQAAVTIGEKIVNTDPKAVAQAMPDVAAATNDPELASRAKVLITRAARGE